MPAETKKARSVVALSRVPRGERGAPVSPPAVSQVFGAASDRRLQCLETSRQFDKLSVRHAVLAISLRAAVRPLVRMPTDRHTATGTCEFGHYADKWIQPRAQEKIARSAKESSPTRRE